MKYQKNTTPSGENTATITQVSEQDFIVNDIAINLSIPSYVQIDGEFCKVTGLSGDLFPFAKEDIDEKYKRFNFYLPNTLDFISINSFDGVRPYIRFYTKKGSQINYCTSTSNNKYAIVDNFLISTENGSLIYCNGDIVTSIPSYIKLLLRGALAGVDVSGIKYRSDISTWQVGLIGAIYNGEKLYDNKLQSFINKIAGVPEINEDGIMLIKQSTAIDLDYICGNKAIKGFKVEKSNKLFINREDGVLVDRAGRLICYPAGKDDREYALPIEITKIAPKAFCNCQKLKTLLLHNFLSKIDNEAFLDSNIETIELNDSLLGFKQLSDKMLDNELVINKRAFANCHRLTRVVLPDNTKSIDANAFSNPNIRFEYHNQEVKFVVTDMTYCNSLLITNLLVDKADVEVKKFSFGNVYDYFLDLLVKGITKEKFYSYLAKALGTGKDYYSSLRQKSIKVDSEEDLIVGLIIFIQKNLCKTDDYNDFFLLQVADKINKIRTSIEEFSEILYLVDKKIFAKFYYDRYSKQKGVYLSESDYFKSALSNLQKGKPIQKQIIDDENKVSRMQMYSYYDFIIDILCTAYVYGPPNIKATKSSHQNQKRRCL